jgi:ABC-2 type transport system ATP-binding protein
MPLVGLQGKENVKLSKFSRGMLQRIGIAQSLINDPELIILDEPITGLDPKGRKEVKEILLNLKEQGRSIFFCSHVLHDVQEMCTDIGIINRGQLVCAGPISDLLAVKEYSVSADNIPQDTRDQLENIASSVSKTGDTLAAITDSKDKYEEIKGIMDEKGQNVTVSTTFDSLEDFFLRKIESTGKEEE